MTSTRIPNETARWIAGASDVELSRAVVEERQAYLKEALAAIEREVQRRGLDPERVVAEARVRERRRRLRSRNFLYGGLVLAGFGLIQGLWPRPVTATFVMLLDNPDDDPLDVRVGALDVFLPPGDRREVQLVHGDTRSPVESWLDGEGAALALSLRIRGRTARRARVLEVPVRSGGRYLVAAATGERYVVEAQRYVRRGAVARPVGPVRTFRLPPGPGFFDLDAVPLPQGGTVRIGRLGAPFPAALELPAEGGPDDGTLIRYRLVRDAR